MNTGTLYLCATPIGNLDDMTFRAVEILKNVDFIAAEDTRRTRKLLAHFDIHTPLIHYDENDRAVVGAKIIDRLKSGESAACVTDAGTPGISDPGFLLGAPENPGEAEGFWQTREYLARAVEDADADGRARLLLKNRFFAGDELELMTADGIRKVTARPFIREKTGETLDSLGVGGEIIRMALPGCRQGDLLRGPVRNHRTENTAGGQDGNR